MLHHILLLYEYLTELTQVNSSHNIIHKHTHIHTQRLTRIRTNLIIIREPISVLFSPPIPAVYRISRSRYNNINNILYYILSI